MGIFDAIVGEMELLKPIKYAHDILKILSRIYLHKRMLSQTQARALISQYGRLAVEVLQCQIQYLGYSPFVHFELEGGYIPSDRNSAAGRETLDYKAINRELADLSINGRLKPEYWRFQWEYVSTFEGQPPLKVADDLVLALKVLPSLLNKNGAQKIFIKPVMWGGDQSRLETECKTIFSAKKQTVHVPNAIQINISAVDKTEQNVIPNEGLGESLQQCLLETSRECSLLFLPEQEAFERLQLKDRFGLSRELSSPNDLSGGHQGSIALYKKLGKHNQLMGEIPVLYDNRQTVIVSKQDWRPLSRIEHRLGASSLLYNPYANTAFALANLCDALLQGSYRQTSSDRGGGSGINVPHNCKQLDQNLPVSLYRKSDKFGAYELFENGQWFENTINQSVTEVTARGELNVPAKLGSLLKQAVLDLYNRRIKI